MDTVTDTYKGVEKMLDQLSWKAARRFNGDFDDYRSVANEAFLTAYEKFDPVRGIKFSTFLHWCVSNAIWGQVASDRKRNERFCSTGDLDRNTAEDELGRVGRMMTDLSDDARTVVELVTQTPGELVQIVRSRKPLESRRHLWRYLRELGWTMGRVLGSFEEIREALTA